MKKILLLVTLVIGFTTFSQYEDELKMLHTACVTDEVKINSLFNPNEYKSIPNDSLYIYEKNNSDGWYVIIRHEDGIIANYIETYSRSKFKAMKNSIRRISKNESMFEGEKFFKGYDFYYMVSNFKKKDSTIVITVTKIN